MIGRVHALIIHLMTMTGFWVVWKVVRIFRQVKAVRNEKTPSNNVRAAMGERVAEGGGEVGTSIEMHW